MGFTNDNDEAQIDARNLCVTGEINFADHGRGHGDAMQEFDVTIQVPMWLSGSLRSDAVPLRESI